MLVSWEVTKLHQPFQKEVTNGCPCYHDRIVTALCVGD